MRVRELGGNPSRRWRLLHETHCRLCPKGSPKAGVSSTSAHRRTRPQKHFRGFGVAVLSNAPRLQVLEVLRTARYPVCHLSENWPTVNGLNGIGIKCAKAWLEVKWSLTEAGNTSWKEPQRSLLRPTDLWPTAPTHDVAQYVINGIAIAEHSKVCLQLQLELCIVYYCVFSCFFVVRCGNDFLVFAPLQSIAIWGLAANRQSKLRKLHLRQRLHPWYPVTRNVLWQSLAALAPRLLSAAKHQCRKPSTLQRGRDRMKREVEAQYQHIKIIKC